MDETQGVRRPACAALVRALLGLFALATTHTALRADSDLVMTVSSPGGAALLALDPDSGLRRTLAVWSDADLWGVAAGAHGELYVVDRGVGGAPARLLVVDPRTGARRVLSSGGFLARPTHCVLAPDGELIVVDADALGGQGAVIRVDVRDGRQRVITFGGLFEDPSDVLFEPSGALLVLDHRVIRVDSRTGAQELVTLDAAAFDAPLACELDQDGGAVISDGGALLHIAPDGGAAAPIAGFPRSVRDLVLTADGRGFFAWSENGLGGILRGAAQGLPEALLSAPELAGVRALALLDEGDGSDAGDPDPDQPFQAPGEPELPAATIELRADTVTLLHGPGTEDDEVLPAGGYPLVTALRAATPGSDPVIGVFGDIPGCGVTIGAGDSDFKAYVVHWGAVPMRFALVGETPDARIREFAIWQRMNDGTVNGGVLDACFKNLTIEARYSQCVSAPKGHSFGLLRFYDCHFVPGRESLAEGGFDGYGYRWGIRSQGRGRWDLRRCSFERVQEHAVYVDSPQGDCYFVDLEHKGSTRTAIQIVNRCFDNPGPSGFGTLLFENVHINDLWGDGGSGITVAGHLGELVFRGIRARMSPGQAGSHGAIAVWTDASPQHGAYLHRAADGRLYSTRRVTIESTDVVLPHADRALIAISGAEETVIDGFAVHSDRAALNFDSPYGVADVSGPALVDGVQETLAQAHIANGAVHFGIPCPLSRYAGFGTPVKIQLGSRALDDGEIDRTWCP